MWLICLLKEAGLLPHLLMLDLPPLLQDAVQDINETVLVMLEAEVDDVLIETLFLKR